MNLIFQTVLSMSFSGTLLILALLLGERLWKRKLSRQWQYYIWLVVLLRLFLPFGPEASLMARAEQTAERMMIQRTERAREAYSTEESTEERQEQRLGEDEIFYGKESATVSDPQASGSNLRDGEAHWKDSAFLANGSPVAKVADTAWKYLWIIWLAAAFAILLRKITVYRSYTRYVTVGAEPVNDTALLDRLAVTAQEMRIGSPMELRVNPLVASPMLVGYFHPCIVLPREDVSTKEFQYIAMHELTHYKRRDIVYKWMVQLAVCLHWFNPLVYVMRREIEKACEFACDEAVIRRTGYDRAKDYGETLLGAMAAGLTVGIVLGTIFIGVFPTVAAETDRVEIKRKAETVDVSEADAQNGTLFREREDVVIEKKVEGESQIAKAEDLEKYYKGRSLPMFHIAFGKLAEKEQEAWLDRIYADGEIDFFSVSVWQLDADSPLIQSFAEKFYEEDDIAFFSVLANQMDEETLEKWLDLALADEKWNFQSMLYHELERDDELDALEKAKEEERLAQYRAVGGYMEREKLLL